MDQFMITGSFNHEIQSNILSVMDRVIDHLIDKVVAFAATVRI